MLAQVPQGYAEVEALYGVAGQEVAGGFAPDRAWAQANLQRFALSFPMRESWAPYRSLTSFIAHRLVGAAMADALEEVCAYYGLGRLQHYGLDYWGGVHNPRLKTGQKVPSLHAWGVAIDVCPALGPFGEPSRMPWVVVEAFTKRGFEWGGLWRVPDGHHFQAAGGC